jgi:hypothetical protein
LDDEYREIARDEHRERVLTWALCHNIHERFVYIVLRSTRGSRTYAHLSHISLAFARFAPSMITDSLTFVRFATLPLSLMCEHLAPYPEVFQLLRVYRVANRINKAITGDPDFLIGPTTKGARVQLRVSLARELAKHELEMQGVPPIVEIQLLRVKLALYQTILDDAENAARTEDIVVFRGTVSRILELAEALADGLTMDVIFWPRSLYDTVIWALVS